MAKSDQPASKDDPAPPAQPATRAEQAKGGQGVYGSGGSYGVGGGFDDTDTRTPQDEHGGNVDAESDGRADRAARTEAQQEGEERSGFEREVDPDAAPPASRAGPRSAQEEALAAKKRRGSRV